MKRIFLFALLILSSIYSFSQYTISGKVFDDAENPLVGAIIVINSGSLYAATDQFGYFEFRNMEAGGVYTLRAQYIGFNDETQTFTLVTDAEVNFKLQPNELNELDQVVVSATRAAGKAPIAFTNIQTNDIQKNNDAQDIPYILRTSPSITITSDAGTGIGYTQMRVRGTDMSRINVTLNGIPLNDPESHGVWWVDIPDFASSVDNIQIQRGVGSSTNGAGAFGASINLKSNKLNGNSYAQISNSFGSFNTIKNSVKFGTGTINEHFVFDGRLSRQTSDGFIDRAWSDLKSFYVSAAYFDSKTLIRATIFSGLEETYQAWNGVPKDSLLTNRTYNYYTYQNEIDHYVQSHYQFKMVRKFTDNLHLDLSAFYIKGKGYYEQFKADEDYSDYGFDEVNIGSETVSSTDLVRRKWLDNDYYGMIYNVIYEYERLTLIAGGGWNKYNGQHFGDVIWMKYAGNNQIGKRWYDNTGIKTDLNNFLKIHYDFMDELNIYGDFQYRVIDYTMDGVNDDLSEIKQTYKYSNFINPKLGLFYHPSKYLNVYLSYSIANKEPKRSDFIDAPTNKIPVPEKMNDYELGYKLALSSLAFEINMYYMDYKNQLIVTGEINDVGDPIVVNTPVSFRRGIELVFGTKLFNTIEWNANLTLSQNKIENFTEYVDNWSYWDDPDNEEYQIENYLGQTDIAMSPSVIGNNIIGIKATNFLNLEFVTQYVSRQYIDNTSDIERSINPYLVNDFVVRFNFETNIVKNVDFSVRLSNVFDQEYESNAWVYSYYYNGNRASLDGYFPQAGRNFMLNLTLKF
ncbi:MAG: TonB-dependent receptor [Bacteroidales bacterium]|nr:TonB-dependent receptor [Bacteroidales bacterium]